MDHAVSQWDNAIFNLNITHYKIQSEPANQNPPIIVMLGGTPAEINARGLFDSNQIPASGVAGRVLFNPPSVVSTEGNWTHISGDAKTGYTFQGIIGCVVDQGLILMENRYRMVATHELGHALGWMGHTSDPDSIMYPNIILGVSITTLTDIDKRHLRQVYDR